MNSTLIGVVVGGALTLAGQALIEFIRWLQDRANRDRSLRNAAILIRDDISGALEAVYEAWEHKQWWPEGFELDPVSTTDDRRALAAYPDANAVRQFFGSQRRFNQLRSRRRSALKARSVGPLSRDEQIEILAVFFELATARRELAQLTGYGANDPFRRPMKIDDDIKADALATTFLESVDGLYVSQQ